MAFIYCQSCGTKHNYSTSVPNFCSKCGTPLSGGSGAHHKQNPDVNPESSILTSSVQPTQDQSWRNVKSLDFDIRSFNDQPLQIGDVISKGSLGSPMSRKGYEIKSGSAVKDILKSCQSSKPQDIDDPTRKT